MKLKIKYYDVDEGRIDGVYVFGDMYLTCALL